MQLGTVCLRRLAEGRDELEIRFGRLLRNPRVTVEGIVAGWSEETLPAVAGRHVLGIQDSSEINFRTSNEHTRGLGPIGKGVGRGLILHPMIAVDAVSKERLGLVGGTLWSRDEAVQAKPAKPSAGKSKKAVGKEKGRKRKKKRSSRPLAEKESCRWIETAQTAKSVLSQAAQVTMVADREADIYEMWALVPSPNVHVLGRAYQDRNLVGGGTLNTAADWPVLGRRRITIRERDDRPEREADLELRAGSITIPRPRSFPGQACRIT